MPSISSLKGEDIVLRGELIMKKSVFEEKYSATNANVRNMVAGLMNRKTASKTLLNDIDFVAYEVIIPSDLSAGKQYIMMNSLQESGSLKDVALHELNISPSTLSNEYLSEKLIDWRDNYEYEIDGVIVSHDGVHPRTTDKFPEYAFAFKMVLSEQVVEAKVLDVLWTPSKDGYLKPVFALNELILVVLL